MLHVGDSGQFAVIVQDAFIDMGEPQTHDDKFYILFLRTYEDTGE
ncbi:hypothetical protein [Methanococcoides alaskense]|uniref:Uncharacterized protein n=1 Tax=Methanococcoides alaskense TaxID=325778 RepID=A0AA90TZM4_9EURY|nr:hypothetical protein [Methanococcoides alaskense]MDA0524739.1 hypothetical protein [Methanococcoides alaskense]MDR6223141.1 hypothetical protein [Methanococcoides alaskense]